MLVAALTAAQKIGTQVKGVSEVVSGGLALLMTCVSAFCGELECVSLRAVKHYDAPYLSVA